MSARRDIVFWQDIVSPHQQDLLAAIARDARFSLTHMVVTAITQDRVELGWAGDEGLDAKRRIAPSADEIAAVCAIPGAMHIHQGLRPIGFARDPLPLLAALGTPFFCAMERPDMQGPARFLRRLKHAAEVRRLGRGLNLLCAGRGARAWFEPIARGSGGVFDYAYFIDPSVDAPGQRTPGPVRIVYASQLIPRKRVDLLLAALAELKDRDWTLSIVGDGPLRAGLEAQAAGLAPRVSFLGVAPRAKVLQMLAEADLCVLPSDQDGWGAVIEESLGAGTPVVCTDGCGASALIVAERLGAVIPRGDKAALAKAIADVSERARAGYYDRAAIVRQAGLCSGKSGAHYLAALANHVFAGAPRPAAPWLIEAEREGRE